MGLIIKSNIRDKSGIIMKYIVGQKIISKKRHACGGNVWTVVRVGADIKVKCDMCDRTIFFSYDEMEKFTKSVLGVDNDNQ